MRFKESARKCGLFVLSQWLLVALGLVILFAFLGPNLMKNGGWIAAQWTIQYGAIAVIFLVSGLSMPLPLLLQHAKSVKLHIVVQGFCFLITPTVFFAIVQGIVRTRNDIDFYVSLGLVMVGTTSTTISSNIIMTRISGGDDSATLVEVALGNIAGIFISPALMQLFTLPGSGLENGRPTGNVQEVYRRVMLHLGTSALAPLVIGQVIRYFIAKKLDPVMLKYKVTKVGPFMLLLLVWSTFSNAFAESAFADLSASSIILLVFLTLGLYAMFTVMCFLVCRPPGLAPLFDRRITAAVCFCGPAKSQAIGFPLIQTLYTGLPPQQRAIVSVPLVLYQVEQLAVAQGAVYFFTWWIARGKKVDAELGADDESPTTSRSSSTLPVEAAG